MRGQNKKRHIRKAPEECPEQGCSPEIKVERGPDKQWPHEAPCSVPKEAPTQSQTFPEYTRPEAD
jgi:hypothetical protein